MLTERCGTGKHIYVSIFQSKLYYVFLRNWFCKVCTLGCEFMGGEMWDDFDFCPIISPPVNFAPHNFAPRINSMHKLPKIAFWYEQTVVYHHIQSKHDKGVFIMALSILLATVIAIMVFTLSGTFYYQMFNGKWLELKSWNCRNFMFRIGLAKLWGAKIGTISTVVP